MLAVFELRPLSSLTLARALDDLRWIALLVNNLGELVLYQRDTKVATTICIKDEG